MSVLSTHASFDDDEPVARTCSAVTADGRGCSNPAKKGTDLCGAHSGEVGRKSKFTPETTGQILRWISAGVPMKTAAAAVGVGESTFYRWRKAGEEDEEGGVESDLAKFWADCSQAQAEAQVRLVARVLKATEEDPGLALEMLARRWPAEWGKQNTLTHKGSVDANLTVATDRHRERLERLSATELEELYRLRQKMDASDDEGTDR